MHNRPLVAACALVLTATPALAQNDIEFPAPTPLYPFQRSILTGRSVVIPPYPQRFPIRVYSTPQQQPYYNVPPYAVISPY